MVCPGSEQTHLTRLLVGEVEAGRTLLGFLSGRLINESKATLRRLTGEGRVRVNGSVQPSTCRLGTGDVVEVSAALSAAPPPEQVLPLRVLYEDATHLCLDKPAGWPVLPGRDGRDAELYHSVIAYLNRDAPPEGPYLRPHVVHRLDRETTGVLLVAKDAPAARALSLQFQRREVRKEYLAVAEGVFPRAEARLEIPLEAVPGSVLQMRPARKGGKPAVTVVEAAERFGHFSLLRLTPHTGRQHQIRVHLAATGYPLAVDGLYGRRWRLTGAELNQILGRRVCSPDSIVLERCPLHAASIRYRHPGSGAEMCREAALPADMRALLEALRGEDPPE
ncbi:MAG: RluA family pseudouridine synthase [Candidatus Brocadiaceae bacterium]|jgi:RluA family pseudouridine synthase